VELDRQSIEKRDFPIGRRGYDPAAVDAHLRALATEVEELSRTLEHRAGESLGSSAGTQVQGILEAAEATAADIEQKASEDARRMRAEADSDAERTRANAVERAQAHVAAVAQATAVLIERVESMDGEASTLVESLRAGAGRLSSELKTVETNMAELYDAAAGRGPHAPSEFVPTTAPAPAATPVASAPPPPTPAAGSPATPPLPFSEQSPPTPSESNQSQAGADNGEGARLIALNMALNGDSRAATDRYLAEHYQLSDRQQLLDEVYAVIEG
jgi:F0F1-type ATP synthase membrane subunit b/b'